jgi:predicted dehydrogenase
VTNDVVRWGVLATGGIAARFAADMQRVPDGDIVAVGSRSAAGAEAFGERFGIGRRHASYEGLLADDEVDVVYVATPHVHHKALTIAALDAGRHVLCEKPLALDHAQARAMTEAAAANDRFLMEAVWSRFLPAYRTLTDLVAAGRIGEPLVVESDFGFRRPVEPDHRLFDPELGGGSVLDLGIYPLQLCRLVLGEPDDVRATGEVGETGVDEVMAAVLHHRGGTLGVVKSAIRVPLSCTARISGSEGAIDLPAFMHCPLHLVVNGEVVDTGFEGEGLRFQVEEVHRCLRDGRRESDRMPWSESLGLAATMDEIRRQLGVVYPHERG